MNSNLFGMICLLMTEESQIRENLYCVDMKIKFEYSLFKCEILYYQQLQSHWSKLNAIPINCTMFILFLFSFVEMISFCCRCGMPSPHISRTLIAVPLWCFLNGKLHSWDLYCFKSKSQHKMRRRQTII